MHRVLVLLAALVAVVLLGAPVSAQTSSPLDDAAAALRSDPVYVAPDADRGLSSDEAASLRAAIRDAGQPLFVAVLPGTVLSAFEASSLPEELARRVGLQGTYAVVAGDSFRAGSNVLPAGTAGAIATESFQSHRDEGTAAVLRAFVEGVGAAGSAGSGGGFTPVQPDDGNRDPAPAGSALLPVLLAGGGVAGIWAWRRRRRRQREVRAEFASDRQMLQAELSVLGEDVLRLEPQVLAHPEARDDYDAATTRYRAASAAMDYADEAVDLIRVKRVLDEGQYAMARVRAVVAGREPPAPPAELQRPGLRDEPPVTLDHDRQPVYVGGGPFYGGGWFGGGGSFFGGLLLGGLFGGGLFSGGWHHVGWGGGWGDTDAGGFDGGGGDWGGGDFGGDAGGGDW